MRIDLELDSKEKPTCLSSNMRNRLLLICRLTWPRHEEAGNDAAHSCASNRQLAKASGPSWKI